MFNRGSVKLGVEFALIKLINYRRINLIWTHDRDILEFVPCLPVYAS